MNLETTDTQKITATDLVVLATTIYGVYQFTQLVPPMTFKIARALKTKKNQKKS